MFRTSFMYVNRTRKFVVKIWSEWNVARLVLPVSAIVVLFWTAGLWTGLDSSHLVSQSRIFPLPKESGVDRWYVQNG